MLHRKLFIQRRCCASYSSVRRYAGFVLFLRFAGRGGVGNGTQQKRHRPHHFPLCYSGSLGVTSHCSSRLLSLSAFKAIALPSYSLAPAKVVVVKNRGRWADKKAVVGLQEQIQAAEKRIHVDVGMPLSYT
ncbi:hypothetical protein RHMOL_Rhmol09G0177900 [Rhododendron molle]|uniref:Uncharacterized protein n=1 Tax=Rhododendron molle TaxID=49168 RepID=A0ACC0ME93_RHOML|nr:hypothetical protein RHMOL_Rhmol09G0177900 [Rhododendron molle]